MACDCVPVDSVILASKKQALVMMHEAGFPVTPAEQNKIEVSDFGMNNPDVEGLQLLNYLLTTRVDAKILVLFPHQSVPEHIHPPHDASPGKEESLRILSGELYLYIPGPETINNGKIPSGKEPFYNARHEVVLKPGEQFTITPGTPHWFQGGPEGTVMLAIQTKDDDGMNIWRDPQSAGCVSQAAREFANQK